MYILYDFMPLTNGVISLSLWYIYCYCNYQLGFLNLFVNLNDECLRA